MTKWYEKTVEYAFIRQFTDIMAMPLDGEEEGAGDGIFSGKNKFFLVEFKKNNENHSIEQEKKKYKNHPTFIQKIEGDSKNKCHLVIYGSSPESKFILQKINYIDFINNKCSSSKPISGNNVQDSFSENLIDYNDFKNYVKMIFTLKSGEDSSSSEGIISKLENILIIDQQGNAGTLNNFIEEFKLQEEFRIKADKETTNTHKCSLKP